MNRRIPKKLASSAKTVSQKRRQHSREFAPVGPNSKAITRPETTSSPKAMTKILSQNSKRMRYAGWLIARCSAYCTVNHTLNPMATVKANCRRDSIQAERKLCVPIVTCAREHRKVSINTDHRLNQMNKKIAFLTRAAEVREDTSPHRQDSLWSLVTQRSIVRWSFRLLSSWDGLKP
jgi:hypothetical protein